MSKQKIIKNHCQIPKTTDWDRGDPQMWWTTKTYSERREEPTSDEKEENEKIQNGTRTGLAVLRTLARGHYRS